MIEFLSRMRQESVHASPRAGWVGSQSIHSGLGRDEVDVGCGKVGVVAALQGIEVRLVHTDRCPTSSTPNESRSLAR